MYETWMQAAFYARWTGMLASKHVFACVIIYTNENLCALKQLKYVKQNQFFKLFFI